jgi:hypothetical protein
MKKPNHNFFLYGCLLGVVVVALGMPPTVVGGAPQAQPLALPAAVRIADVGPKLSAQTHSVARLWNEELLAAIRRDTPRPTVHARNLFHVSLAMYDAWAAYDDVAHAVLHHERAPRLGNIERARHEAISYAAYRVLSHRFARSPGQAASQAAFDDLMAQLGYPAMVTTTQGMSAAALGNRVAAAVIAFGLDDGANEAENYADSSGYAALNPPLVVALPGAGEIEDINRWQPLLVPGASQPQRFLTPHWRQVRTFALERSHDDALYLDPGPPPLLGGVGDDWLKADILEVIRASGGLDPDDGVVIDISPGSTGNNALGSNDGSGHPLNPVTGQPYADNPAKRGDWGRVLAEFWADGPQSSTPPGHWNEIANAVSDHPDLVKRIGGIGMPVNDLEWDVKLYLALNGAVHDSAIATWEMKAHYDFSRPLPLIRAMAELGQSSDPTLPSFHPMGLPLEPGVVELISAESSAEGERHAHLAAHQGMLALRAWRGHPQDPTQEHGGVGWILADTWLPYQQFDFVTPPFAGYTSGHSGFSRASAEVLAAFTGSPWFPGGLGEYRASSDADGFDLGFEFGPSEDVLLQWATYADAADEAGISRIHGGIHPSFDDLPGRWIGFHAGHAAITRAMELFGELEASAQADDHARTLSACMPPGQSAMETMLEHRCKGSREP